MRTALGVLVVLGIATATVAQPTAPVREQRERELALVRHIRRHVLTPGDGLAMAGDRRDLERRGPGLQMGAAAPAPLATADAILLDRLSVVADLWYVRIVQGTPFHLIPRERVVQLGEAIEAIGQLQSHAPKGDRDQFLPDMLAEAQSLTLLLAGQGEVSETDIDLALALADQVAAGRPAVGRYPGSSPAPPSAAAATATTSGCQVLRESAGASGSATSMMLAVECWRRLQAWPGWAAQTTEAIDWAATYARIDHDCATLGTIIDEVHELGKPLAAGGQPSEITALAERAEGDRWALRSAGLCR